MKAKGGKRAKYSSDMPKRMYTYFISYTDTAGAPSFDKFARSAGLCAEDIEGFRAHSEFERAYRECSEIRRDYLIDMALTRRFDPSFTKFLLTSDDEDERDEENDSLTVKIEVSE